MSPLSLERRLLRNCYRIATGFYRAPLCGSRGRRRAPLQRGEGETSSTRHDESPTATAMRQSYRVSHHPHSAP